MSAISSLQRSDADQVVGPAIAEAQRRTVRAWLATLGWRARAGAVLAVAGACTASWYALHWGEETTDDAQVMADIVAVPAQTSGIVSEVLFHDNEHVAAGAVLARIDSA